MDPTAKYPSPPGAYGPGPQYGGYPPATYGTGYGYPPGSGPPPMPPYVVGYPMPPPFGPPPQPLPTKGLGPGNQTNTVFTAALQDPYTSDIRYSSRTVRQGFIRKVYSILTIQMFVTSGTIALFIFVDPVKEYVQKNMWIYILALVTFLTVYFGLICCCAHLRKQTPHNYILLSLLTLSLALMTGVLSSKYNTEVVLMAMGMTALVTLSLSLFAIQTKIDFTMCNGLMFTLAMVLIVFGIITLIANVFFGYSKILNLVYACIGTLCFSVFIVYDTQRIIGGEGRADPLEEEEYIFATMELYLDIVQLFLFILRITAFGSNSNNSSNKK